MLLTAVTACSKTGSRLCRGQAGSWCNVIKLNSRYHIENVSSKQAGENVIYQCFGDRDWSMSTLSFWLMLLIDMRVDWDCLTDMWHTAPEWPQLRRDKAWWWTDNVETMPWLTLYWLETVLRSIQHGSDWCHVDTLHRVYVVIRCQVLRSLVLARLTSGSCQCHLLSDRETESVSEWPGERQHQPLEWPQQPLASRWLTPE